MKISSRSRELYLKRFPTPGPSEWFRVVFSMSFEGQINQAIDYFVHKYDAVYVTPVFQSR